MQGGAGGSAGSRQLEATPEEAAREQEKEIHHLLELCAKLAAHGDLNGGENGCVRCSFLHASETVCSELVCLGGTLSSASES